MSRKADFSTAMLLAAGLGKRMRPLTETRPKPLIEVAGKSLADHVLDRLAATGVETVVVNVHYLADLMETHVGARSVPKVLVSDERAGLLDSGGGVRKALSSLPSICRRVSTPIPVKRMRIASWPISP